MLLITFIIIYEKYFPKNCIFADSLLIVSYIQGTLRKELIMATFLEPFKNAALVKSYW